MQLSTGDLLRAAVAAGTEAGRQADAVMKSGGLVSDEIVLAVLKDRLADPDTAKGVILDGFPRTAGQASALDGLLQSTGQRVNSVISLDVEDEPMIARVAGRYTCADCGEGYHDLFKRPATAGACDRCGGADFNRRADDNAETAGARLAAYHAETAPLITYYEARGVLQRVDAMADIAAVSGALSAIISQVADG